MNGRKVTITLTQIEANVVIYALAEWDAEAEQGDLDHFPLRVLSNLRKASDRVGAKMREAGFRWNS